MQNESQKKIRDLRTVENRERRRLLNALEDEQALYIRSLERLIQLEAFLHGLARRGKIDERDLYTATEDIAILRAAVRRFKTQNGQTWNDLMFGDDDSN